MTIHTFSRTIPEISVEELAARLAQSLPLDDPTADAQGRTMPVQLIDVREPDELEIARIDGFVNLPLSRFAEWSDRILSDFDPQVETIVLCHHGIRSAQMCQWLIRQGFTHVQNVAGGIAAYGYRVDRRLAQY